MAILSPIERIRKSWRPLLPVLRPIRSRLRKRTQAREMETLRLWTVDLVTDIFRIPYEEFQEQGLAEEVQEFNADGRGFAVIEINNTCNIDCLMCKTSLSTRGKGRMQESTLEGALQSLSELQIRNVTLHTIGDPLANPRLPEMLSLLRKHEFTTNLSTNGLLLDRHVDTLLEYRDICAALRISIDGASKEVYEKIRAGGKWEDLMANLNLFQEKMAPKDYYLTINMTVSQDNRAEVGAYISLFRNYVRQPFQDLRFHFVNSLSPDPAYFDQVNLLPLHTHSRSPCPLVVRPVPYVLVNGDVSVCCRDYDGSMVLGNILTQSIEEIQSGDPMQKLKEAHRTGDLSGYPLCANCNIVDRRIGQVFSNFMKYMIYKRPDESAEFYQGQFESFLSVLSGGADILEEFSAVMSQFNATVPVLSRS